MRQSKYHESRSVAYFISRTLGYGTELLPVLANDFIEYLDQNLFPPLDLTTFPSNKNFLSFGLETYF